MNIKTLGSLAIAALLLTACSNEEWLSTGTTNGVLTASVEGSYSSTRAGFDGGGNFYWSNVDYIGVTSTGNANGFSPLKLVGIGGTASATFEGDIVGNLGKYAVYPIKDKNDKSYGHSIAGTTLTYNFPESYTYDKVDADYFTATQGEGNSFNPAMFGIIKDGGVTLKHLGGVICIKIEKMPVAEGTLTLTADKQITGEFTVLIPEDLENNPMECSAGDGGSGETVKITFKNASTTSSGVFYVPVPVGTYSLNIKVVGTDESNPAINVAAGTYTIERCDLKKIELNEVSVGATASSLNNLETDLKNNDNVSVDEIPTGTKISIPAVDNSTETSSKSLSLQNVASGADITVTDGSTGGTNNSVKNFTLAIPNNESATVEDLLDVTITMPNTTVTLVGNGGSARYGTVTAETADNTLVIGSDVEVAEVLVNKGNVLVKKGAKLAAIKKNSLLETVVVYWEKGAELSESVKAAHGFEIIGIDAEEDVAAEEELRNVAKNGGTFQLKNEMVLSYPLVVEEDMTLNLNGHALKAKQDSFTDAEGLVGSHQGVVLVRRGGHLTVTGNGSIDYNKNEDIYSAIVLTNKADEDDENRKGQQAQLTVNGGHLKGHYYGICGQGTRHGTVIEIHGGIVESQNTGVYHPQDGTMTVTGGEIRGVSAAVELRSGTIEVSGGKLVATATEFSEAPNGSGTTMSGAALAVSQHSTDKAISVEITNGELTGVKALYEKDLQNANSGNVNVVVEGGTFNGGVYSKTCSAFVTGGTFTDPNVLHYLGEGATVTLAKSETAMKLSESVEVKNTGITIDLDGNTLTSKGKKAFVVSDGASVTIKNGHIGTSASDDKLSYGVYANGSAEVTLENVVFSEMVMYAYNGAGTLTATGCKFQGWLSGWHYGGFFDNCTFTKGKAWYPAAICYGDTEFKSCKFYQNSERPLPDDYGDIENGGTWNPPTESNGYFDCNYVVSAKVNTTVTMTQCTFFKDDESKSTGSVTKDNHPYLTGWGDAGTWAQQLYIGKEEVQVSGGVGAK